MRGLLLDTHVWLWYLAGDPTLPRGLRHAVDEAAGGCWLSPVTLWEVAVLARRGRLHLDAPTQEWTERALAAHPVRQAALTFEVARAAAGLELAGGDPVDHLLAATARVHELTLVSLKPHLRRAPDLDLLTG